MPILTWFFKELLWGGVKLLLARFLRRDPQSQLDTIKEADLAAKTKEAEVMARPHRDKSAVLAELREHERQP